MNSGLAFLSLIAVMAMVIASGCVGEGQSLYQDKSGSDADYSGGNAMGNSVAVFDTSMGTFKVMLYEDQMPVTAGNFIKLAKEGFYDGVIFHRVIADFMIQGGDPTGTGTGGPGYTIEDEFVEGLSNVKGTIAMANTGQPNSGGSQFFINLVDNVYLDWDKPPGNSKHPVFGKVVEGMGVVEAIGKTHVGPGARPVEDVIINSIRIE